MDARLTRQRTDTLFERDYQFDLNSNIDLISDLLDASQNQHYRYDALDRITEANRTGHDIQYDYDPVGNRLDKTVNGASEVYQYGVENHRLSQITGAQTIHYQYDAAGNTVQKNNDLFNYHLANRLATATVDGQTTHYLYNAQGQRTLKTNALGTTLFVYDLQGQLIAELNDQGQTEKETVYLNGQPLAQIEKHDWPANPLTFTAERTQWTGVGEDLGDTVELTLNTQQPSLQAHFINGQSRHYDFSHYQDHTILGYRYINAADYSTLGLWSFFYASLFPDHACIHFSSYDINAAAMGGAYWGVAYRADLLTPADPVYYFHNDHLGTPHTLTDQHGSIVWEAHYTPFGQATVNEDPDGDGNDITQNIRFPGQYFDQETGLYYNWNRYYDALIGRYITSDPIGLEGGINTYLYAGANPLNFYDPNGLAKLPNDPNGLGDGWVPDPSHQNPNGEKWNHPESGGSVEWHPGQPGKPGWRGKDHWHVNGGKKHYPPGTDVPEFPGSDDEGGTCSDDTNCRTVATVVITGSTAYIVYRCIRMLPSMMPPLWPTIPANAAIP